MKKKSDIKKSPEPERESGNAGVGKGQHKRDPGIRGGGGLWGGAPARGRINQAASQADDVVVDEVPEVKKEDPIAVLRRNSKALKAIHAQVRLYRARFTISSFDALFHKYPLSSSFHKYPHLRLHQNSQQTLFQETFLQ